ncbi:MAG: 16S rRNA (cytidine(1402)-2'-O)-methyltransferase [Gammaproteobacteria bacterium]
MEGASAARAASSGVLYLVATPIGNLGDIGARALEVLRDVDAILAEDTRHTQRLLNAYGLSQTLMSLHEHNEAHVTTTIVNRVEAGASFALVSDAGTPLISDPGYRLVSAFAQRGLTVSSVPGACAAIAALSVSGLACDRFVFEGFLPARGGGRTRRLATLVCEPRTIVLYEAPHRIETTLADLVKVLGPDREAVLARELTKIHETVLRATLAELTDTVRNDPNQRKGEIVLVLAGYSPPAQDEQANTQADQLLNTLLAELPLKQAVRLAATITGRPKNDLYTRALALTSDPADQRRSD